MKQLSRSYLALLALLLWAGAAFAVPQSNARSINLRFLAGQSPCVQWTCATSTALTPVLQTFDSSGNNNFTLTKEGNVTAAGYLAQGGSPGGAGGAVQGAKKVSSIADNTATTVLTVTVPNAAHSAVLKVTIDAALGAGGAVGACEETLGGAGSVVFTRTAGVNATASAATLASTSHANVSGGDSSGTLGYSVSSVSGGTTATNTFNVQVTIAHGAGSSTNHTAVVRWELVNTNGSGVTVS